MSPSIQKALMAVLAVAVLGWVLRRSASSRDDTTVMPGSVDPEAEPPVEADDDESDEKTAVTSDGYVFMPRGDDVLFMRTEDLEIDEHPEGASGGFGAESADRIDPAHEPEPLGHEARRLRSRERLEYGSFIGARVVRGSPDEAPWMLEALGREGEYRSFPFETEDAARVALALLEQRIVHVPVDENGSLRPVGDADYASALERIKEGASEVAMSLDESEPTESGAR